MDENIQFILFSEISKTASENSMIGYYRHRKNGKNTLTR